MTSSVRLLVAPGFGAPSVLDTERSLTPGSLCERRTHGDDAGCAKPPNEATPPPFSLVIARSAAGDRRPVRAFTATPPAPLVAGDVSDGGRLFLHPRLSTRHRRVSRGPAL